MFKLVYLENKFGDPYFLFYKTISYITINYVTNFKKILSGHKKVIYSSLYCKKCFFKIKNGGHRTYFQASFV